MDTPTRTSCSLIKGHHQFLLQLSKANSGDFVLLPAGAPVPHASGGPRGPGCVESPRLFARQCRLGPSSSRCVFPGGDDETGAAPSPWNKSLRSRLRLAGIYSDANERFVRAEFTGAGGLAEVRFFLDLGFSDAGVCSSVFQPSMVGMSMERCRRTVVGIEDGRLVDLGFYLAACWCCAQVHGRRSMGCVPGRSSSTVFCLCVSFQSIRAMVLLPTLVSSLWLPCSGVGLANNGGRRRQQQKVDVESTKDLWDLIVIFLLCKVFCVSWCVHLSSLYVSRVYLYLVCLVYVFALV